MSIINVPHILYINNIKLLPLLHIQLTFIQHTLLNYYIQFSDNNKIARIHVQQIIYHIYIYIYIYIYIDVSKSVISQYKRLHLLPDINHNYL